jgi:hypothetical protein
LPEKIGEKENMSNPNDNPNEKDNLSEIEEEIETSSQYFKPKPENTYVIRMDPRNDKIVPVENDRFKDANGKPLKRYECKIPQIIFEKVFLLPRFSGIWSFVRSGFHNVRPIIGINRFS